uniref:DNA damage-regulated autophagy modulator protein 1-like n=1 Tax=Pogona vitticeps TaxID=103695 RepID=A0ABM5GEN3_9SAUR
MQLLLIQRQRRWWHRMACSLRGEALVPVLLVFWTLAAFIISYVIAVLDGHVEPFFPYISDTGANPPESIIFGIMIAISAVLGAITMIIRYLILRRQNEIIHFISSSLNLLALCFGILGCIGIWIVARFPELTYPAVHDGGALVAFVSGTMYIVLQTAISYKLYKQCPQWCTPRMWHARLVLSIMTIMALVPMITCDSLISITKIDWNPGEKEYVYHLVSAVCEWTVAFGFEMFFLTFVSDFQRASEDVTKIPESP